MMRFFSAKRNIEIANKLPIILNVVLIGLGVFILLTMSVVVGVFEEFTAFTDYTQDWIEFNFFIHYWDRITISRVYLSFLFVYGGVILAIAALQIHGYRKNNMNLMYFAPYLLIFVAIVSMLGAIFWLIITAVNHNEGFLATGGFIFERMRFKGNIWKDLKYREQSWKVVTSNQVPDKAPILKTWVHQRERDFECCGWDSYLDYKVGGFTDLPESCCKRKQRKFGCGANYLIEDKTSFLNTRGCKNVMYDWYKRGFGTNIAIAVVGIVVAAYEFFLYSINRREYLKLNDRLNELKNMKIPFNTNMKINRSNSKVSIYASVPVVASDEIERVPLKIPMRNFYNQGNEDDDVNDNGDVEIDQKNNEDETNFDKNNNRSRKFKLNADEKEKEWLY